MARLRDRQAAAARGEPLTVEDMGLHLAPAPSEDELLAKLAEPEPTSSEEVDGGD